MPLPFAALRMLGATAGCTFHSGLVCAAGATAFFAITRSGYATSTALALGSALASGSRVIRNAKEHCGNR